MSLFFQIMGMSFTPRGRMSTLRRAPLMAMRPWMAKGHLAYLKLAISFSMTTNKLCSSGVA